MPYTNSKLKRKYPIREIVDVVRESCVLAIVARIFYGQLASLNAWQNE